MTYVPAADRYDSDALPPLRPQRAEAAARSRSACGTTSAASTPLETGRAIVRRAFDLGITHFDLANNYGPPPGSAEENFGQHPARRTSRPYRDELVISTKAGYRMWPGPYGEWGSRKYLLASLDQSLQRMGLDYVDIFYSHRPDPDTPLEETMGALDHAVRAGKALYVGISNYTPEQTPRGRRDPARPRHAAASSTSRRTRMFNRWIEDGLLDVLERGGHRLHRLLAARPGPADRPLPERHPGRLARGQAARLPAGPSTSPTEQLAKVRRLERDRRGPRPDASRRWRSPGCCARPVVTSALIGASSVAQLDQNLDALARAGPLEAGGGRDRGGPAVGSTRNADEARERAGRPVHPAERGQPRAAHRLCERVVEGARVHGEDDGLRRRPEGPREQRCEARLAFDVLAVPLALRERVHERGRRDAGDDQRVDARVLGHRLARSRRTCRSA